MEFFKRYLSARPDPDGVIDYKRELEAASRGMILIHDPQLLIKLIVRMIVSKLQVKHAGMILYDPAKDIFVLKISRGERGLKIPAGFARFSYADPVIALFTDKNYRTLIESKNAIVAQEINKLIWQESVIANGNGTKELLHNVAEQMRNLSTTVCVPAYYRSKLLAVLLLGEKADSKKYTQHELDFFSALASDVAMAIRNAQLFTDLKDEAEKNHDLFIRTTKVLSAAIEIKDQYTHGHNERVTEFAHLIARQMNENGASSFDDEFMEELYIASILHDIGKIGIPDGILNKTGRLTAEEYEIMKQHPNLGVNILNPLSELKDSLLGVKYHHERYDGTGYPEGLKGDAIPDIAAIISVADALDAMISDRPYRKGMSIEDALNLIKENAGTQFSPKPVQALMEVYEGGGCKLSV